MMKLSRVNKLSPLRVFKEKRHPISSEETFSSITEAM
jgi:hypothetical protein